MLAYRYWRLAWSPDAPGRERPVLLSYAQGDPWWGPEAVADRAPEVWDEHGLHAFSDERSVPRWSSFRDVLVEGAVDAYGLVQVHEDGVVRAERMRVLALRVMPPMPGRAPCGRAHLLDYLVGGLRRVVHCDCDVDPREHDVPGRRRFALRDLEEALLRQYGVPRLPNGAGPWNAGAKA